MQYTAEGEEGANMETTSMTRSLARKAASCELIILTRRKAATTGRAASSGRMASALCWIAPSRVRSRVGALGRRLWQALLHRVRLVPIAGLPHGVVGGQ